MRIKDFIYAVINLCSNSYIMEKPVSAVKETSKLVTLDRIIRK